MRTDTNRYENGHLWICVWIVADMRMNASRYAYG